MDRRIGSTPTTVAEGVHAPLTMVGPSGFTVGQGTDHPPAARWVRPR
jgi:hypothetical protein